MEKLPIHGDSLALYLPLIWGHIWALDEQIHPALVSEPRWLLHVQ